MSQLTKAAPAMHMQRVGAYAALCMSDQVDESPAKCKHRLLAAFNALAAPSSSRQIQPALLANAARPAAQHITELLKCN
jgi:hypothetical protein